MWDLQAKVYILYSQNQGQEEQMTIQICSQDKQGQQPWPPLLVVPKRI